MIWGLDTVFLLMCYFLVPFENHLHEFNLCGLVYMRVRMLEVAKIILHALSVEYCNQKEFDYL